MIYIVVGIIIGYGIFVFLNKEKFSKSINLNERDNKILDLIESQGRVSNNDVEKLLNVSDSTATRYLQSLEDKKEIQQHFKSGQYVYYTKK